MRRRVVKLTCMPSLETSRVNLAGARNPWTSRPREESTLIWRLTLQWWIGGRDRRRNPPRQREWAKLLGVSQPYVAKMVLRLKRDWREMADTWRGEPEATLDDLRRLRAERLAHRALASALRPAAVVSSEQIPLPPDKPAWATYSTMHPEHIDAAILTYLGINSTKSRGWF